MSKVKIEKIKEILADVYNASHDRQLDPREIGDDELLYDFDGTGAEHLDFDSLDALEVAAHLEELYDMILPSEIEPANFSTPRRIFTLLSELLQI